MVPIRTTGTRETGAKTARRRGEVNGALEGEFARFEGAGAGILEASEDQVRLAARTGKRTTHLSDRRQGLPDRAHTGSSRPSN